jgi:hypothetical protein
MKNTNLRILIRASLLALISGIVVAIIGSLLRWNTSLQFSDGFFWAGALMIFIGLISYQGYSQRPVDGPQVYLEPEERSNLWAADTSRGKNIMAMCGISGVLLLGFSLLVGRLV